MNDLGGGATGGGGSSRSADTVVDEIKRQGGRAVSNYGEDRLAKPCDCL